MRQASRCRAVTFPLAITDIVVGGPLLDDHVTNDISDRIAAYHQHRWKRKALGGGQPGGVVYDDTPVFGVVSVCGCPRYAHASRGKNRVTGLSDCENRVVLYL